MLKRIEISDTRLEKASSTVTADIDAPGELKMMLSEGCSVVCGYITPKELLEIFKTTCAHWESVRKVNIVLEAEDDSDS